MTMNYSHSCIKKTALLFLSIAISINSYAQVIITTTPNSNQVAHALTGLDVSISNVEINCSNNGYAKIDAEYNPIFYGQGLALTSGEVNNINGPNNTGSMGASLSLPGDTDLTIVTGVQTYDACILAFDITTLADTLFFYYFFGSEEYPEFVDGPVNDAFGVFISGPGINGSFVNNAANFALIPQTNTPVTINTVNNGNNDCQLGGPTGPCENCQYYVDNCSGTTFQYDGFTTMLEGVVPVTPNQNYHIKLAVADGGDGVWDSGVFFPQGAFRTSRLSFVGIEDHEANDVFAIFPNPASTQITIQSTTTTNPQTLKIINTTGQLVFTSLFDVHHSLFDISNLPPGLYHLRLEDKQGRAGVKKLVVAR